ncbi:retinol dehydrogenase 11 [Fusarium tjaetaba]|uniref:Retinol dehydrogenase 11 n=1 Tax=Fusarium tjaetaba TaxID=1567544 RepID=A0A8H5RQ11_9HYPO|nr:retinol dehydrogenase 11 [Fusarium tjaetaba]KAF5637378.1 retinol dehydrogenase 11 [Fusarium tjaetaba]
MAPRSLELAPDNYRFFRSQTTKPVPIPKDISLSDSTIIITGANTGIGYGAAEQFLAMNLKRLIIAVRSISKGETAASTLRAKHPKAEILVWQVDMNLYKSVQDFAKKCETLDRIDLVILNAGIQMTKFELSPEGHEVSFQVNYLSTVLLATLLLPTLKQKAPAGQPGHLTIVNSGTSLMADFPNAKDENVMEFFDKEAFFTGGVNPLPTYSRTKALAHFWIVKLAERVKAEDVIVNLVDPGLVGGTSLTRGQGNIIIQYIFAFVNWIAARNIKNGASTFVQAGVVMGKETHGSYLQDWRIHHYTKFLYTKEGKAFADKVWYETNKLLSFANVDGILNSL